MLCRPPWSTADAASLWDATRPPAARQSEPRSLTVRLERMAGELVDAGIASGLGFRAWHGAATPSVVVALPATGEQATIATTLRHLRSAFEASRRPCGLVVFANNCADATAEIVAREAPGLPAVLLLTGRLAAPHAHAGWARRIALDAAAHCCAPDGAILTTDADTWVPPTWIDTMAAALEDRFDLVSGTIRMQQHPELLHRLPVMRLARAERAYALLQDRLQHACDQIIGRQPFGGPQPHYVEAGANMGLTRRLYQRIGGLPPVPSSEDRALVRTAELAGARILYTACAPVETSNRLIGRARGGLAETLRRRLADPDPVADQRLRPVSGLARMWSRALAVAARRRGAAPAVRHARLENEWLRSMTEPRMAAADLEREWTLLAAFLREVVEPAFGSWRACP